MEVKRKCDINNTDIVLPGDTSVVYKLQASSLNWFPESSFCFSCQSYVKFRSFTRGNSSPVTRHP